MHASAGHCAFVRAGRRAGAPPARIPAEAGSPCGLRDARPAGRRDAQCFTGLSSMPTPIVRLAPRAACGFAVRCSGVRARARVCACAGACACVRGGRHGARRPARGGGSRAAALQHRRRLAHAAPCATCGRRRRGSVDAGAFLYIAQIARCRRAAHLASPTRPTRTIRLPIIVTSRAAAPVPAAAIARIRVHTQRAACRSRCAA